MRTPGCPTLGDLWPYTEAAVPPELAALPVDVFFSAPRGSGISAAQWLVDPDPAAAPRASYALRLRRAQGQGELARWDPARGRWRPVRQFSLPDRGPDQGHDQGPACAIIQLRGVLLSNIATAEQLAERLRSLLQAELTEMKTYRFLSKVLSIASVITLYYSIRNGVETRAIEPFLLVFALAVGLGMLAVGLRARCRTLSDIGLARMREQFQFEYRAADHPPLTVTQVTSILKDHDRRREEEAVIFGFLLLLCFVYFISPLVVIGVFVALVVITLMTGDSKTLRTLAAAFDRSETRLEQAFLSFRASDDQLSPPALRRAKKQVLRDRIRRYGDMLGRVRAGQARARLTQDLSFAVAFLIVFSAYAFPIAAGFQKMSIAFRDSLVETSLFSVAPVIILLSISKTTVALAQIVNRRVLMRVR
ncbi:MAG: hypothetical protein AB7S99_08585 [Pseudodonghicola sp.]